MSVVARRESQYDRIVNRLRRLSPDQLDVVQAVVDTFDSKNEAEYSFVSPLGFRTEKQLWAHIEESVAQADAGSGEDADAVIDELFQEFAL